MLIFYRAICIIIGYAFGLFQTSYIYGRLNHVDIRNYGSGNAGTTNAMRVLGKKAGIITYIGDMLKGVLAGVLVRLLCAYIFDIGTGDAYSSMEMILIMYTGIGVVLGHNYPFYMNFKGGKGIAASSGVVISLFFWPIIIIDLCTFIFVVYFSKYVSLGSICLVLMHLVLTIAFGLTGYLDINGKNYIFEFFFLTVIFVGIAIFKHRGNIKRLINGTERRIGEKKNSL